MTSAAVACLELEKRDPVALAQSSSLPVATKRCGADPR